MYTLALTIEDFDACSDDTAFVLEAAYIAIHEDGMTYGAEYDYAVAKGIVFA